LRRPVPETRLQHRQFRLAEGAGPAELQRKAGPPTARDLRRLASPNLCSSSTVSFTARSSTSRIPIGYWMRPMVVTILSRIAAAVLSPPLTKVWVFDLPQIPADSGQHLSGSVFRTAARVNAKSRAQPVLRRRLCATRHPRYRGALPVNNSTIRARRSGSMTRAVSSATNTNALKIITTRTNRPWSIGAITQCLAGPRVVAAPCRSYCSACYR
jgi:hypothetical protein